jgi:hypothetical protein
LHPPFVEPGVDVIHQLCKPLGVKDSAFASSAYNKLAIGLPCDAMLRARIMQSSHEVIDKDIEQQRR